jgi:hypothetical protein
MLRLLSTFIRRWLQGGPPAPRSDHPRSLWPRDTLADARAEWSASEWARVRAPERVRDQELSTKAARWMAWLPADVRPQTLAAHYPRIVNKIAACWRDVGITERLLEQLLHDERGDRMGFAPAIVLELEAVQRLHVMRLAQLEQDESRWRNTVPS